MRRSVLFFTSVLAAIGCGSDPATVSDSDEEQNPSEPSIETGIRPPVATGIDQIAPIEEARSSAAEDKVAASRFSDRALIRTPSDTTDCLSSTGCVEVHRSQGP